MRDGLDGRGRKSGPRGRRWRKMGSQKTCKNGIKKLLRNPAIGELGAWRFSENLPAAFLKNKQTNKNWH